LLKCGQISNSRVRDVGAVLPEGTRFDVSLDAVGRLLIPILTFSLGALIVAYHKRNDDMKALIDEAVRAVREFADRSCEYWRMSASDPDKVPLETIMIVHSTRIGAMIRNIRSLHPRGFRFQGWRDLAGLRQSATSSPFQTIGRNADPGRCTEIVERAEDVVHALHSARRRVWI
jgi:hypothetical protein